MILIFDTYSGLCNQMYDIFSAINFCHIHNIYFTFRYANFRNNNLVTWTNVDFNELFDTNFLNKYKLYIPFDNIKNELNDNNTFNLNKDERAILLFNNKNITLQLNKINKKYIILKQFWSIFDFSRAIINNIYNNVIPCKKLMDKYYEIRNKLLKKDEKYNFLHYRYEHDFVNHFKLKNISNLDDLVNNNNYKNKDIKIYIAASNINNLLKKFGLDKNTNIIHKNENDLDDLNFEQKAFIDYMFGINSLELYGHKNSSFSNILNNLKKTNNYY
jgi:hypothetical protein